MRALRLAALLLVAVALPRPGAPALAADEGVRVEWDPALAFPHDRAAYEARVQEIARDAERMVAAALGWRLGRRVVVRVETREAFERAFGTEAARVEAAHYGRDVIHLNGGSRLDDRMAGLVVPELVHAFLDSRGDPGRLPTWLNEGLAERLAWQRKGVADLSPTQLAELKQAREAGRLLPLPVDAELSRFGYLQCWAAVLYLERTAGREKVVALVRRTLDGEPFARALAAEAGLSPEELERGFATWVERRQGVW